MIPFKTTNARDKQNMKKFEVNWRIVSNFFNNIVICMFYVNIWLEMVFCTFCVDSN